MYERKMWDLMKLVLDNCKDGENYDFSKIDPDCRNVNTHPLMLLARSGQETIIKHETTNMLLNLKWRFIPRFLFYSNILFYLFYLLVFSIYTIEIANGLEKAIASTKALAALPATTTNSNSNDSAANATSANTNDDDDASLVAFLDYDTRMAPFLLVVVALIAGKKLAQVAFIDGLSFVSSVPDWCELSTYALAILTIVTSDVEAKFAYGSLAILFSYIVFSLLIQKMRVVGLYVMAFKRTLANSAKFMPIFLIIYVGFLLSFRLRSNFGVSHYSNSTSLSLVRTFTMVIGDLNSDEMGLNDGLNVNYFIYCFFISIMCVIILNLFVGIAVGEISTVLNEADIQQISMRIVFVLRCQAVLAHIGHAAPFAQRFVDIRFAAYRYDDEFPLVKARDRLLDFLKRKFSSKQAEIKLEDPQKRLEENLTELARITNDDLKTMRETLAHQISDVAQKLGNAQLRLEDTLLENSRKSTNNIETTQEGSSSQLNAVEDKLMRSQRQMAIGIHELQRDTHAQTRALRQSFLAKFGELESHFLPPQRNLELMVGDALAKADRIYDADKKEFGALNILVNMLHNQMHELQFQLTESRTFMGKVDEDVLAVAASVNAILGGQAADRHAASELADRAHRSERTLGKVLERVKAVEEALKRVEARQPVHMIVQTAAPAEKEEAPPLTEQKEEAEEEEERDSDDLPDIEEELDILTQLASDYKAASRDRRTNVEVAVSYQEAVTTDKPQDEEEKPQTSDSEQHKDENE